MHGAWCWDSVLPLLKLPAVAVDLPGRGRRPLTGSRVTIDSCVDAVLQDADAAGFARFVLVGHSMGGLTITETANRAPHRVAHAAYVAALSLPPGSTVFETFLGDDAPDVADLTAVQPVMAPDLARQLFAEDLGDEAFAQAYQRFVPEPIGLFLEGVSGYTSGVPATYVRCSRDRSVTPALADRLIEALGPEAVYELDSDHDVMLSHPDGLANLLNDLAVAV
jgi:pimeloyl-ACP methyl ester carboxylesterase